MTSTTLPPAGLLYAQAAEYQARLEAMEDVAAAQMRAAWGDVAAAQQRDLAALTQRIHMIHRIWGCVTALTTAVAAYQVWRRADGWPTLRRLMLVAPFLVALQIVLGIYVVLTFRSVPVAVGHFAGAMSLWALWFTAWLISGARDRAVAVPKLAPVRGVHAVP